MSDKVVFRIVAAISVFVFLVVLILNRKVLPVPFEAPSFLYQLPMLNAFLNGTCTLLLLASYYNIRRKNITIHKRLNLTTFALSSLFLVSYIVYHYFAQETHYGGEGAMKYVYYFILITHITLAAIVLPLVLISFYFGLKGDVKKHRKMTRWSFPIWLYVTTTGVIVYMMISPYYLN